MKKTIQSFKRLFPHLKNDEHYKFHFGVIDSLSGRIGVVPPLVGLWNDYKAAFYNEDAVYKLSTYSPDTEKLKELNRTRSEGFFSLRRMVAAAARSLDDKQREAGRALGNVLHNYRLADRLAYVEETSQIINCLQDLRLAENRKHINLLGLSRLIDELEAVNTQFEDIYNRRSLEWSADRKTGRLSELRQAVDSCFDKLADTVEVLYLYSRIPPGNPAQEALLGELADIVNGLLGQAKAVYYRRVGKAKRDVPPLETVEAEVDAGDNQSDSCQSVENAGACSSEPSDNGCCPAAIKIPVEVEDGRDQGG